MINKQFSVRFALGVVNWETFVVGGVTMVTSFCPCAAQRRGFRPIPPIPLTRMLSPLGNSHENAESKTKVSQLHNLLLWNLHFQQHQGWKVESQKPELVGHKLARARARACAHLRTDVGIQASDSLSEQPLRLSHLHFLLPPELWPQTIWLQYFVSRLLSVFLENSVTSQKKKKPCDNSV